jgi:hypothetical protein
MNVASAVAGTVSKPVQDRIGRVLTFSGAI